MIVDHRNRDCDCRKASLNGHHDCQYLDVATTFTSFIQLFLKQPLLYIETANQIYDKNISKAIRNMDMDSNNLTS